MNKNFRTFCRSIPNLLTACCVMLLVMSTTLLVDRVLVADEPATQEQAVRAAINRSIPLLEAGAAGSAEQRQCFTCHNQALPVFALAEAQSRDFKIDEANFERQLAHTAAHLDRGKNNYRKGRGQGGQVLTAGYALWTLAAGGRQPDETTAAVTHYLLDYQKDQPHWRHTSGRPPSSDSNFTATYVALRGLADFGTNEQQPQIDDRVGQVADWLLSAAAKDTEDRVFRLRAMAYIDADKESRQQAVAELVDAQNKDGGWSQSSEMTSDAYATGSVLATLLETGDVSRDQPAVQRGVQYLLRTQQDDGSWHVASRGKPFQTYFESGFPHGKDQFISISASSWATLALLLTLPPLENPDREQAGPATGE